MGVRAALVDVAGREVPFTLSAISRADEQNGWPGGCQASVPEWLA